MAYIKMADNGLPVLSRLRLWMACTPVWIDCSLPNSISSRLNDPVEWLVRGKDR